MVPGSSAKSPMIFRTQTTVRLALRIADFTTAGRVGRKHQRAVVDPSQTLLDPGTIEVDLRGMPNPAHAYWVVLRT